MPKVRAIGHRTVASFSYPEKGEGWLWEVTDAGVTYHHFIEFGYVTGCPTGTKPGEMAGVQLVIGPFLFSIAWLKKESK